MCVDPADASIPEAALFEEGHDFVMCGRGRDRKRGEIGQDRLPPTQAPARDFTDYEWVRCDDFIVEKLP